MTPGLEPLHPAKDSETTEALVVWRDTSNGKVVVGKARANTPAFEDRAVPAQGFFRHYKGGQYALLHHAVRAGKSVGRELVSEDVVVYRNRKTQEVWVRSEEAFFGTLDNGARRFAPESD